MTYLSDGSSVGFSRGQGSPNRDLRVRATPSDIDFMLYPPYENKQTSGFVKSSIIHKIKFDVNDVGVVAAVQKLLILFSKIWQCVNVQWT